MAAPITVRAAQPADVAAIAALINGFAAQQLMLPRSIDSIVLALDDFVVVTDARRRVIGCGALKEYSPSLAEVASLAVAREAHGRGVGRAVVAALETLARRRGHDELFALTLSPAFFESLGYETVPRTRYPEKMRRDCAGCARRFTCGEICVGRMLRADTMEAAA